MAEDKAAEVVSLSGSPVYRHGDPAPWQAPAGEECLEQISNHVQAHLGEIQTVFQEVVSDAVHIDVHVVSASDDFPFLRLVTSGMSDLPMAVPEGADASRYVELFLTLPGDWKLDRASLEDERWYWPIRLLKGLARLPHKHATWIGFGHTIPNGDPAEPYAPNTKLSGAIVLPAVTVPDAFHELRIDDAKTICFFYVVPIFEEEMRLKLRSGTDALLDRFSKRRVTDIVDLSRPNVAKKRFGLF